ncbi:eukaryotic initiation factor 4G middle domain containing protein, putative [Babesia bigemina]|uniref:Eukaryotic initiation factor 4G middle domain containing protein, putative n=1 Tax=Babesia bigemina TaxID=5866 RepID=A0A061D2K5_BABBI|nr:eukaryotic initiation factor 4G middle domain containing protein, putative [Babesia bigemina]CDR94823.1 eukaryotic initiation factor 4G middle domain containing protein, putative [Babesia bigemina]|eukprot:XP_012767009.1 eukaryotic initiation factor 4G middle domain containing protein, putative [Babesia bigemina]
MDRYPKRPQKKPSAVAPAPQGQATPLEGSADFVAMRGSSIPGSGDLVEMRRFPRNRSYGKSSFVEGRDRASFYRGPRMGKCASEDYHGPRARDFEHRMRYGDMTSRSGEVVEGNIFVERGDVQTVVDPDGDVRSSGEPVVRSARDSHANAHRERSNRNYNRAGGYQHRRPNYEGGEVSFASGRRSADRMVAPPEVDTQTKLPSPVSGDVQQVLNSESIEAAIREEVSQEFLRDGEGSGRMIMNEPRAPRSGAFGRLMKPSKGNQQRGYRMPHHMLDRSPMRNKVAAPFNRRPYRYDPMMPEMRANKSPRSPRYGMMHRVDSGMKGDSRYGTPSNGLMERPSHVHPKSPYVSKFSPSRHPGPAPYGMPVNGEMRPGSGEMYGVPMEDNVGRVAAPGHMPMNGGVARPVYRGGVPVGGVSGVPGLPVPGMVQGMSSIPVGQYVPPRWVGAPAPQGPPFGPPVTPSVDASVQNPVFVPPAVAPPRVMPVHMRKSSAFQIRNPTTGEVVNSDAKAPKVVKPKLETITPPSGGMVVHPVGEPVTPLNPMNGGGAPPGELAQGPPVGVPMLMPQLSIPQQSSPVMPMGQVPQPCSTVYPVMYPPSATPGYVPITPVMYTPPPHTPMTSGRMEEDELGLEDNHDPRHFPVASTPSQVMNYAKFVSTPRTNSQGSIGGTVPVTVNAPTPSIDTELRTAKNRVSNKAVELDDKLFGLSDRHPLCDNTIRVAVRDRISNRRVDNSAYAEPERDYAVDSGYMSDDESVDSHMERGGAKADSSRRVSRGDAHVGRASGQPGSSSGSEVSGSSPAAVGFDMLTLDSVMRDELSRFTRVSGRSIAVDGSASTDCKSYASLHSRIGDNMGDSRSKTYSCRASRGSDSPMDIEIDVTMIEAYANKQAEDGSDMSPERFADSTSAVAGSVPAGAQREFSPYDSHVRRIYHDVAKLHDMGFMDSVPEGYYIGADLMKREDDEVATGSPSAYSGVENARLEGTRGASGRKLAKSAVANVESIDGPCDVSEVTSRESAAAAGTAGSTETAPVSQTKALVDEGFRAPFGKGFHDDKAFAGIADPSTSEHMITEKDLFKGVVLGVGEAEGAVLRPGPLLLPQRQKSNIVYTAEDMLAYAFASGAAFNSLSLGFRVVNVGHGSEGGRDHRESRGRASGHFSHGGAHASQGYGANAGTQRPRLFERTKADNKWRRDAKPEVPRVSPFKKPDISREEQFKRSVRSLLNKLTVEKFLTVAEKLAVIYENLTIEDDVVSMVDLVLDKSVSELDYSDMYADLAYLLKYRFNSAFDVGSKSTLFFRVLMNKCQDSFETLSSVALATSLDPSAANSGGDVLGDSDKEDNDVDKADENELLGSVKIPRGRTKKWILGNIRFMGELFLRRILSVAILKRIARTLLQMDSDGSKVPCEYLVESFLELITTIGYTLEQNVNGPEMLNEYMEHLVLLKKHGNYNLRIVYKIQDLIDLRSKRWVKKVFKERATSVASIHYEAKQEELKGGAIHLNQEGKFTTAGRQAQRHYTDYLLAQRKLAMERTVNGVFVGNSDSAASGGDQSAGSGGAATSPQQPQSTGSAGSTARGGAASSSAPANDSPSANGDNKSSQGDDSARRTRRKAPEVHFAMDTQPISVVTEIMEVFVQNPRPERFMVEWDQFAPSSEDSLEAVRLMLNKCVNAKSIALSESQADLTAYTIGNLMNDVDTMVKALNIFETTCLVRIKDEMLDNPLAVSLFARILVQVLDCFATIPEITLEKILLPPEFDCAMDLAVQVLTSAKAQGGNVGYARELLRRSFEHFSDKSTQFLDEI